LTRQRHEPDESSPLQEGGYSEAAWIGLLGTAIGILPIILANRFINLEYFSHYALPASLAVAVFIAGLAALLSDQRLRLAISYSLILFAVLTHTSIPVAVINEESAIESFWWQVSWRVPALKSGTTLVIKYPLGSIGDDGNGVRQVPNLIYFPQPSNDLPVQYKVSAVTLSDSNLQDVMVGKLVYKKVSRSHAAEVDYSNVLVISQPAPTSCVHVIDGGRPLLSTSDPGAVILAAPSSNIDNVILDDESFSPPGFAFGPEPDHGWCYYFEKADLAVQRGDWKEAAALGEHAILMDLHPEDPSEWMPFLLAYAMEGNAVRVRQTAPKITGDRFLRLQACEMLTGLGPVLGQEVQDLVDKSYCRTAE
jgi:hypothetical protein